MNRRVAWVLSVFVLSVVAVATFVRPARWRLSFLDGEDPTKTELSSQQDVIVREYLVETRFDLLTDLAREELRGWQWRRNSPGNWSAESAGGDSLMCYVAGPGLEVRVLHARRAGLVDRIAWWFGGE